MFWRRKNKKKTKIVVQFDAGVANTLFLRGEGIPHLNWDKGIPLKNVKADEWHFETDQEFKEGSFKILINDVTFEMGDNHPVSFGTSIRINPKFQNNGL